MELKCIQKEEYSRSWWCWPRCALLSSNFINFCNKSTAITALTQNYQILFSHWQFHSLFSSSPLYIFNLVIQSCKEEKRDNWKTDIKNLIQGPFYLFPNGHKGGVFLKQKWGASVFSRWGAPEQCFVPWKQNCSERSLWPLWWMRAAYGKKDQEQL